MSINFDGTNDGYDADVSVFGSNTLLFAQGFLNYDPTFPAANRTIFKYVGSGTGDSIELYLNSATLSLIAVDNSGPSATSINATISAAPWYGFQCYASNDVNGGCGLRVWTTDLPGAFTTGTGQSISGLDTMTIGYNGSGQYFDGQLAGLYFSQFMIGALSLNTAQYAQVVDSMAALGSPIHVLPILHDQLVNVAGFSDGLWWRMQDNSDVLDVFRSAQLTAVDSPSSSASHPRIYFGGGRKVRLGS